MCGLLMFIGHAAAAPRNSNNEPGEPHYSQMTEQEAKAIAARFNKLAPLENYREVLATHGGMAEALGEPVSTVYFWLKREFITQFLSELFVKRRAEVARSRGRPPESDDEKKIKAEELIELSKHKDFLQKFHSQSSLARALGITRTTLSNRMEDEGVLAHLDQDFWNRWGQTRLGRWWHVHPCEQVELEIDR